MIEFDSLTVKIGERYIVKNADLRANDGEITVLLGKNGSGKTTLIRSVFSTRGATSGGKILLDGKNVAKLGRKALARMAGLLPQSLKAPEMTVRELVTLGRSPYTGSFSALSKNDKAKVDEAIATLGLSELEGRSVASLSGGERQTAYLAMLLAKDVRNILLDEPTASLDSHGKSRLFRLLTELKESGISVIAVLHDLTDAVSLADRIYLLESGTLTSPMTPSEFVTSGLPERIFEETAYTVRTRLGTETVFRPI